MDHDDELAARVAAAEPGIRVMANAHAPGLSGGRDTGVAAAGGDIVAFLDDDAVPRPGWLAGLRSAFDDAGVAAVGGAIVPRWETRRPSWFPDELGWVVGCDYRGLPGDGMPIRNPIGANMAIRRDVLAGVGGFDRRLGRDARRPLGGEETELAIRIARRDPSARILRRTGPVVDHHVPAARATVRYTARRCWFEGVSKGRLARGVGERAGLSSEVRYVAFTLSRGVARHLAAPFTRRDPAGILRAGVLVAATAITTAGFLWGRR